ncbi:hypothetical protein Hamer_G005903, partial [Homarus americanus]
VFSVLRLSDTPGLGPVASLNYHPEDNGVLSVVWADQHTLLVGTDVATVLVLEEGELRAEIHVTHPDLG